MQGALLHQNEQIGVGMNIAVKVVPVESFDCLRSPPDGFGLNPRYHHPDLIADSGFAYFTWTNNGECFMWECPACGSAWYGLIGEQPVSGWNEPRWVNSGTADKPTLMPSLGCGDWIRGTCPGGHFWLRDGVLVSA